MTKVEGLLFCFELSQFTQRPYVHTYQNAGGGGGALPTNFCLGGYGTPAPAACSAAYAQVELNLAFLFSQERITRSEQLF